MLVSTKLPKFELMLLEIYCTSCFWELVRRNMLLKLEKLDMGTWGIGYSDSLDPLTRMVLDVENHAFVFDVIPCSRNIMIRNIL